MKLAYIEPIGGASGDMLLGALVDTGGDPSVIASAAQSVLGKPVDVHIESVRRGAIVAKSVKFNIKLEEQKRTLKEIETLIEKSTLKGVVKQRTIAAFRNLVEAEARVHGEPIESIKLHEVGGDDCILDIVGFFSLTDAMRIRWFYCGTIPFGCGVVLGEHGALPEPPPAVVELLRGFSVRYIGEPHEMTTPTAAAIIKTICQPHIPPQIVIEQVGYGAGLRQKNVTGIPNVLRITVGRLYVDKEPFMWQMEANLDDAEPRVIAHALERILSSGASDAWSEPTYGKKGRLGVKLCALVTDDAIEQVEKAFFSETTTLGIRRHLVQRTVLERHSVSLHTKFGELSLKVGVSKNSIVNLSIEYETAKTLADALCVPLKTILSEGLIAAAEAGIFVGATTEALERLENRTSNHT